MKDRTPVQKSIPDLAAHLGTDRFVALCVDLLTGAPRDRYLAELPFLTGHSWQPGDPVLDRDRWRDYWIRTWGARGLLYVWHDAATDAILQGLADEHPRPAEMCLKVAARHEVAGAADPAALLARHPIPRVRAQALRCLAVTGDFEHLSVAQTALQDPDPAVRQAAHHTFRFLTERLDP